MTARSSRREIRNPVLALPAAQRLQELLQGQPEIRDALAALHGELALQARTKAEEAWRKRKGPMAAYWQACNVYGKHIRAVIRQGRRPSEKSFG